MAVLGERAFDGLNEVVQVAGYGAFGWRVRLGARDTILMERLSIGEQDA
jgi:hypothetical protein